MRVGVVAAAALLFAACQESSPPLAPSFDQPSAPPFARASVQRLPGQYIVVFRRDVKDVRRDATRLAGLHRGRVNRVYESALKGMALSMSDEAAAALRSDPSVAYVEPDQVAHIVADQPNATWGLDRVDQPTGLSGSYRYFANGSGPRVQH